MTRKIKMAQIRRVWRGHSNRETSAHSGNTRIRNYGKARDCAIGGIHVWSSETLWPNDFFPCPQFLCIYPYFIRGTLPTTSVDVKV